MTGPLQLYSSSRHRIERRLLALAAGFLTLFSLALTLSPAVRLRTWQGDYRWGHWLALLIWLAAFALIHRRSARFVPDRDPFLLPLAGLLTGWGLLSIYRLTPVFGQRQALWLALGMAVIAFGLRRTDILDSVRRFKYLWLFGGLLLTALTFVFGTNPLGYGPRLWLGCCGIYLQPSEPLKLLLIIYLAAYLSDRQPLTPGTLPLLAPTLAVTGLALVLLIIQRDLGTASLFVLIYTAVIFVATGKRRTFVISLLILIGAGLLGYQMFDLVVVRIEAWLNPWLDPSGRSYQIVQSVIALASGGLFGRGPGLGSPSLVPVSHSDFIFTAISEESGLAGSLALLILLGLVTLRGLKIALQASSRYHRFLATGITAYFAAQSLLIIGGNIRVLPLTGVTLPFVSYGGSSLLTSLVSLLFLVLISNHHAPPVISSEESRPILDLGKLIIAGLALAALACGWWAFWRGPDLLTRTDNVRRAIADRYVSRGALLDRNYQPLHTTVGERGSLQRLYHLANGGSVLGFTDPVYGQAGAEAAFDETLRGLVYYPPMTIWLNHLLYGQPPPGLNVRLTLDITLQNAAQEALGNTPGAVVILDPGTGEILALASNPSYDANLIADQGEALSSDARSPLYNRAAQGLYQPGPMLGPLLLTAARSASALPADFGDLETVIADHTFTCARPISDPDLTWESVVAAGCPGPLSQIGLSLESERLLRLFTDWGLYSLQDVGLPASAIAAPILIAAPGAAASGQGDLRISPLNLALALASLSNHGALPVPRLALAAEDPVGGWLELPPSGEAQSIFTAASAAQTTAALAQSDLHYWSFSAPALNGQHAPLVWAVTAAMPNGQPSRVVLVLLEDDRLQLAEFISRQLFFHDE